MRRLSDITINKKLTLAFGGSIASLICLAGVAMWALNASESASAKTLAYAHKLELALRMDVNLSEIALNITNLASSRHPEDTIQHVLELRRNYSEDFKYLKGESATEEGRRRLNDIEQAIGPWREMNDAIIRQVREGKRIDAAHVGEQSVARFSAVKSAIDEYAKFRQKRLDEFQQTERRVMAQVKFWLSVLCGISVIAAFVAARVIARNIAAPLSQAVTFLGKVAGGDLTSKVSADNLARADEIGMLAKSVDALARGLSELVGNISTEVGVLSNAASQLTTNSANMSEGSGHASQESHSVAAAAEQMTANAVSVAAGMEQTTANLSGVATATEQMTSTIGEIARNSEKARRITEDATRQASGISSQMNQLGASAQEIGKVTETITEISSQTNLLALNATIEAARAGAAGKGFAVVANEIKELAQQTAAATEDIKNRIAGVQSSTATGIAGMEKISGVIHDVSDIVSSIAAAIEEQSTVTKDIARNIAEASAGVKDANSRVAETTQAATSIARGIAQVDGESRRIAVESEQVLTNATSICEASDQLQAMVSRFHVSGSDRAQTLKNAIAAHSTWKSRLQSAISTRRLDVPVSTIRADNQCQFGRWLYGELSDAEKQSEYYRKAKELHTRFHEEASKVAQFAISGQKEAAERAMNESSEYSKNSSALESVLTSWLEAA